METAEPRYACIRDVDAIPLSRASQDILNRARTFLFGVAQGGYGVLAMIDGYTSRAHHHGVFLTSILSGERSFAEWRLLRSFRPPIDPALPTLIAEVEAFADRWYAIAIEAARTIRDDGDRAEVLVYLELGRTYPSRTWRAKAIVQRVRGLADHPTPYADAWAAIDAGAFAGEAQSFDVALGALQKHIQHAPIDDVERGEIHEAREDGAPVLKKWLDEQAALLEGFDGETLAVLGLGDVDPPDGFEPPIALLAAFRAAAQA